MINNNLSRLNNFIQAIVDSNFSRYKLKYWLVTIQLSVKYLFK